MGVLSGVRVIELAGLGPCPLAGMLMADMGAEVIVIDRATTPDPMYAKDMSRRGKKSVVLDLSSEQGQEAALRMIESADVLIEGYRPGVAERMGIGPEQCWAVNPALIYGRMTGWGQTGRLATAAGHDINYISVTGALFSIGLGGMKPVPPLNLVGDFGGGTMFLVMGVLAALLESKVSRKGQVVDSAMVDGVSNLMWMVHSFAAAGYWDPGKRGANMLDGGAFFYDTYVTKDGGYVAIGSIEPRFFAELVRLLELDPDVFSEENRWDPAQWPRLRDELARVIMQKTREEWTAILEGTDACFAPVLSLREAVQYPHNKDRNAYIEVDGWSQPAPSPRFSRTPSKVRHGVHAAGEDTDAVLSMLGYTDAQIKTMRAEGAVK